MSPEHLSRLIYCSIADHNYDWTTLRSILVTSDRNNERDEITGALLFADGMFLQVLEGGREQVTQTFKRILQDPRHHSISLIEFTDCEDRRFSTWKMRQLHMNERVLKYAVGDRPFDPRQFSADECLNLMNGLADAPVAV